MMNNYLVNNENKPKTPDKTLKATALIYFKEALVNERYEDCAELVRTAKGFGARQSEIRKVIAEYTRGKDGVKDEANRRKKTRPRF